MQRWEPAMRLDVVERWLDKGGERVRLTATLCAMLSYLVRNRQHLVSRQDLLEAVWPERYVSEGRVKQVIQQLRVILEDDARRPSHIENHHGLGYRYVGNVEIVGEAVPDLTAPQPHRNAIHHAPPQPMLGRRAELERLSAAFDRVLEGRRHTACVTGDANVGKSLLIGQFLDERVRPTAALVARSRYTATDAELPVADPLLEMIEDLSRQAPNTALSEALARFAPLFDGTRPDPGTPGDTGIGPRSRPARLRLVSDLARSIGRVAQAVPVVLWFEDAHWLDAASLELLNRMSGHEDGARLLVLCSFRTDEIAGKKHPLTRLCIDLEAHGQSTVIRLSALEATSVRAYMAESLPGLPAGLEEAIVAFSGGHPWLLTRVVEALADTSAGDLDLLTRGNGLRSALPVPEAVRGLFEWQLQELSPEQQEVVETGAVFGDVFSPDSVALATGIDPVEIEHCLEAVARSGRLLQRDPAGGGYRFRYPMCRQAVADRVAPLRRKRILQYAAVPSGEAGGAGTIGAVHAPLGHRQASERHEGEAGGPGAAAGPGNGGDRGGRKPRD